MRLYNEQDLINYLSKSENNNLYHNNLYHVNPFGRLEHKHLKIECFEKVSTDSVKIYFGDNTVWDYEYVSDTFCKDGIKRTFTTKQEAEEYLDYLKSVPILKEVIDHHKECNYYK